MKETITERENKRVNQVKKELREKEKKYYKIKDIMQLKEIQ